MSAVDEPDLDRPRLVVPGLRVANSRRSGERFGDFDRGFGALRHNVDVGDQLIVSSYRAGDFSVHDIGVSIDIGREHVRLNDRGREALKMRVTTDDLDPAQNLLRRFFTKLR